MSLYVWLAVLLGAVTLTTAVVTTTGDPCEYNGRKCPSYRVLPVASEEYELREYAPATWISTTETASTYTPEIGRRMYFRLRDYINGNNVNNQNMNMTVPVLTRRERTDVNGIYRYTKYFFLADANAPDPSGNDVIKQTTNVFRAYVRSFGGKPTFADKLNELQKLEVSIGDPSLYRLNRVFFAGYNPPWIRINRRNEVWLEAV